MKKAKWIVVISILMVLFAQQVCANGFVPFASEEIYSATVSISAKKRVTYNVVVTNPSYKVHVNYCDLYRKAGTNTWEFVASMDMQSLRIRRAICLSQVMFPSILLKAEHTVFELVTQSENPQFPDIQMKELLIN